jgi:hypothetical protein
VTLDTATVIYITPRIAERKLDTNEFLRHEIAHAVIIENTPLLALQRLKHHTWLFEGIPVWYGRQRAYVTQEEFRRQALNTDLVPILEYDAKGVNPSPIDMRFAYIAWRNFLDYLDQQKGRAAFLQFFAAVRTDPARLQQLFASSYGAAFPDKVREFQAAVRTGTFHPRD